MNKNPKKERIFVEIEGQKLKYSFLYHEWYVLERIYLGDNTVDKIMKKSYLMGWNLPETNIRRSLKKFSMLGLIYEITGLLKQKNLLAGKGYKVGQTNRLRVFDITKKGETVWEKYENRKVNQAILNDK